MMPKRYWQFAGYRGTKRLYERELPIGCFTERQAKDLLRALAATGLDHDSILGGYAKRSSRIFNELLEVRQEKSGAMFCGHSVWFSAQVVER